MEYRKIGNSDLKVSKICLGSMTWGRQNTEAEAHEQIEFALSKGVNFIDTAEMYAVPASKESFGLTETYIGNWIAKNQAKRKELVLATKVTGPSRNMDYISRLPLGFSKDRMTEALNNSLRKLNTDFIDLYQLHWPERKSNMFGQRNYTHHEEWDDNFIEILQTLNDFKKEGKIRHYGLSNETPWGTMKMAQYADSLQVNRFQSIQNAYNLLNRTFEHNLSEVAHRENISLLAYSPLAMGVLTGKYISNKYDEPSSAKFRLNRFEYLRYSSENIEPATIAYEKIAKDSGMSLTQMALAFVNQQSFLASNIIGATNLRQLEENISSASIILDDATLNAINEVYEKYPNPAP